jgi:hypothetical protein
VRDATTTTQYHRGGKPGSYSQLPVPAEEVGCREVDLTYRDLSGLSQVDPKLPWGPWRGLFHRAAAPALPFSVST